MPILEFKCEDGHVSEKLFLTFAAGDKAKRIVCTCGKVAKKILSVPGPAIFYGDGWTKPAPSGKPKTVTADPAKAAKEVIDEIGAQNLVKGVKSKNNGKTT